MFKKTMKFDDLEGNEVTQTFYFNYNKKEIAELMEFGQLEEKIALLQLPTEESGLTEQENTKQAYDIFHDLILGAYGEKGADNVTFVKNERTREYWKNHVAFVEMIFEFIGNPPLAIQFIESCLPAKMVAAAKADLEKEAGRKLSGTTLAEMVQEADRRQQDPTTRIEPGLENVPAELVTPTSEADFYKNLTVEDIKTMDKVAFDKLDPKKLNQVNPDLMMAAFERKTKGN